MEIGTFLSIALVTLVILIKLALLVLALILVGRGLFGRRTPASPHSHGDRPPLSER
jgi:hypothetical protein